MDYLVTGLTALIGFLVIAAALYLNQENAANKTYTPIAPPGQKKRKKKKSSSKKSSTKKTAPKKSSAKKSSSKKKAAATPAATTVTAAATEPAAKKAKKKIDNISGTSKDGTAGLFASSYKADKNDDEGWSQVKTKPKAEKQVEETKDDENFVSQKIAVNNVGRIIGKGGETINRIRDESGAEIDIPERGSGNKVTVKGTADAVASAIALIKEEIGDDVSDKPAFSSTIRVNNVGRLIGKGGETIRRLSEGGAKIDTPKQRKAVGNVVKVSGPTQEIVEQTIAEIKEVIGDDDATPKVFKSINIESNQRSVIIGRGGETIRKLSEDSGARIDLLRDTGECKVSGTSEAVESALKAIKAILKKDADTVNEAFDCDSSRFGLIIGRGGETIRALSSEFSVQINTDDNNNQIGVKGSKKNVAKAIAKIEGMLAKQKEAGPFGALPEGTEFEVIEIADNLKGRVIGTRGATIKKLQADSGAKIDFARKGSDAGCRISGTTEQIAAAKKLIDEIKEKAKAQEEKAEADRAKAQEVATEAAETGAEDTEFVGINSDATGTGW